MSNPNKTLEREKLRKKIKVEERGFRDKSERDQYANELQDEGYLVKRTAVRVGPFRSRQFLYMVHAYEPPSQ